MGQIVISASAWLSITSFVVNVNDIFAQLGKCIDHLPAVSFRKARSAHVGHAYQGGVFSTPDHGHAFEQGAVERTCRELSEWKRIKGEGRLVKL